MVYSRFSHEFCDKRLYLWDTVAAFVTKHFVKNFPDGVPDLLVFSLSNKITTQWTMLIKMHTERHCPPPPKHFSGGETGYFNPVLSVKTMHR